VLAFSRVVESEAWLFVLDRADADLKLLSSKHLPKDAFKHKVVWITGASQVHPPAH
jgi:hypothetical protein